MKSIATTTAAGIVTAGLAIGGIALSASGVHAQPTPSVEPSATEGADTPAAGDDAEFAEFERCLDEQLGDVRDVGFAALDTPQALTGTGMGIVGIDDLGLQDVGGLDIDITEALGGVLTLDDEGVRGATPDGVEIVEFSEKELRAMEEEWEAAEDACGELLPPGVRDEMAAFEEFDACIDGHLGEGLGDSFADEMVIVVTETGEQIVNLEPSSSVTISSDESGEVSVVPTGGATIVDVETADADMEALFIAAEGACADLLPEGLAGELFDSEVFVLNSATAEEG